MNYKLITQLVALLFLSLNVSAQIEIAHNNVRDKYLSERYSLSSYQIREYNKVLSLIEKKWQNLKDQKCPMKDRQNREEQLSEELCKGVRKVLPDQEYENWFNNHKGNLTVRFYKEDLGMTDLQFTKFREAGKVYSDEKNKISKMGISGTEQSQQRKQAFDTYSVSLQSLFSSELADYLIQENQIQNLAMNLSEKYTIISQTKAIKYAMLKMQYDKDLDILRESSLDPKERKQKRQDMQEAYEGKLRSVLTNEEYVACMKKRDKLTDGRYMRTYKMSSDQLEKYKELKKGLAIKQMQIKQSKDEKPVKAAKLQAVENEFEVELKKILTAQQFEMWKRDQQEKSLNKK